MFLEKNKLHRKPGADQIFYLFIYWPPPWPLTCPNHFRLKFSDFRCFMYLLICTCFYWVRWCFWGSRHVTLKHRLDWCDLKPEEDREQTIVPRRLRYHSHFWTMDSPNAWAIPCADDDNKQNWETNQKDRHLRLLKSPSIDVQTRLLLTNCWSPAQHIKLRKSGSSKLRGVTSKLHSDGIYG